jgi:hypothetical protein
MLSGKALESGMQEGRKRHWNQENGRKEKTGAGFFQP